MSPNDELYIYPVHKFTGTASHIAKAVKKESTGDLNNTKINKANKESLISDLESALFSDELIPNSTRLYTNIFPIFWKITNNFGHENLSIYFFSDMIHEDDNEKLNDLFVSIPIEEVETYALEKFLDIEKYVATKPSLVNIYLPGTVRGNMYDEDIRLHIIEYWKKLFELGNYSASFSDL